MLRRPRLLDDFLRLAEDPSPNRIVRFANRYGWLGRSRNLAPPAGGTVVGGESLWTWHSAILQVSGLRRLWEWVERDDVDRLVPFVLWTAEPLAVSIHVAFTLSGPVPSIHRPLSGFPRPFTFQEAVIAREERDDSGLLARWQFGDPIEAVRYWIHRVVNDNLKGHVNMAVLPLMGSTIRYFPDGLLAAIWVQFAHLLAGGKRERECANPRCPHRRFIPGRRDQRYCSKNCQELARYHRTKAARSPAEPMSDNNLTTTLTTTQADAGGQSRTIRHS
jgi:hypothetical protein